MRSGRLHRFNRKELIRQFRFGTGLHIYFIAAVPMLVVLMGAHVFWQAWVVSLLWCAYGSWRWYRESRAETADWATQRKIVVRFVDGDLIAENGSESIRVSLSDVKSIEVYGTRRRGPERLIAIDAKANRTVYAGYEDMDAFVRDFRAQAPRAQYQEHMGFVFI
ncbi:hypothetical protein [Pseudoxanthomonas indica]|uniref:Uncharacterized protein n=1 Tax=Pseudoxanthomonas indica TaxID=428993 RepID=A0A1T5LFT1_9GAMM|nr:hypothetical protein [Pseudoxanthomonas indica]GGD34610.1 hypothetical protein GCM10007235_03170 [Pseudoxanthomonas indica]SKC74820.1 hypothetical protein SAMN06296058_2442 [Pseudoxanthomonas indica]